MRNILIYNSGGGLGDSIQIIPLILSLQKHYKKTNFYYLGAHINHFNGKLREFNIKTETLNLDLKYFGFRWWHIFKTKKIILHNQIDKFDLIIDLQSKFRNTFILKRIPHSQFYSTTFNNFFCTKKINFKSKSHLENISLFLNENIKKVEYMVKDLPKKLVDEAERLLPENNYAGFSLTQGNEYRKKSWSIDKFILLANNISKKGITPVFFIKKDNVDIIKKIKLHVPTALFPENNTSLSCPALVTALSTRLKFAVTIDNGIMHMMSLAKIPLIVLFGPTNSDKFAPSYNNVKILDSKITHKSKNLDMISVEEVLSNIKL